MYQRDNLFEISKVEINRNPFIGLYLSACDNFLIHSPYVPEKIAETAVSILKPKKTCVTNIGNSNLSGLFSVLNSNACLVPQFADDIEVKKIESELGVNVCKVLDSFSAIKNNVVLTDKACILNPSMPASQQEKIRDAVGVEVFSVGVGEVSTVGSLNVATNKGLLCYNRATEKEFTWLSKVLKVKAVRGTCNFGTVAISLGMVANSKGVLIGGLSTGFEVSNIFEALSGDE
ncbi:MAG: translation initiation factor IF-6 [Candidatus Micrarchaeota archaeon]